MVGGARSIAILIAGLAAVAAVLVLALLVGGPADQEEDAPADQARGTPRPAEPSSSDPRAWRKILPEDRMYAREYGIPVGEAKSRLDLQDDVGRLAAALREHESETFADLELRHSPEFRVVAYFTRDGKETIRPYVEGTPLEGMVRVRTVEATLEELEAAQSKAIRTCDGLGIPCESGIDITNNRAEIYVKDPARLGAALRRAGERLPEHVAVVEVEGFSRPL